MVTPLPGLHFYRVDDYVSGFWFKLYLFEFYLIFETVKKYDFPNLVHLMQDIQ